jgi:hypothetical protein
VTRYVFGGVEYSDAEVAKALSRAPVGHYLELEQQSGVNLDDLDGNRLSWRKSLACWAFLLRRTAGEQVTFSQVASELVPAEAVIQEEDDEEVEGGAVPGPTPPGGGPSST